MSTAQPTDAIQPKAITTGTGPTPAEIAADFRAAFDGWTPETSHQRDEQLWAKHWSPDIESIEGSGEAFQGLEGMKAKGAEWEKTWQVLRCDLEALYTGATGFTAVFNMDIKNRETGETMTMREAGVYTVNNGKVTREEFMYNC